MSRVMTDTQYTRIVLVEAERQALEKAAKIRGNLDNLHRIEMKAIDQGGKPNPELLAKWRKEAGI